MPSIKTAADEFLAKRRIAVTGVSRKPENHGSNVVYKRLRERGYDVFAVNPKAEQVEGDRAYHVLCSMPGGVDAVVIATRPETAEATMRECADIGIKHVWMHRSFGAGSVSDTATAYGREHGITVIDGGCPCMFDPAADPGTWRCGGSSSRSGDTSQDRSPELTTRSERPDMQEHTVRSGHDSSRRLAAPRHNRPRTG